MYKLFNSLMTAILVLGSGFANAATLMCDHTEARTELAIRARAGSTVRVVGSETSASSGFRWISKEGIEGTIVQRPDPGNIGGVDLISFAINTNAQMLWSKVYTFELRRPWETGVEPKAVCTVKVVKFLRNH